MGLRAMQAGQAKDNWVLEYEPEPPRAIEPLHYAAFHYHYHYHYGDVIHKLKSVLAWRRAAHARQLSRRRWRARR